MSRNNSQGVDRLSSFGVLFSIHKFSLELIFISSVTINRYLGHSLMTSVYKFCMQTHLRRTPILELQFTN